VTGDVLIAAGDYRGALLARGTAIERVDEHANTAQSDTIRDIAEAFLDAHANVLLTHTAGANALAASAWRDAAEPTKENLDAINRQAAALCVEAVQSHPAAAQWVVGVIGPGDGLLLLEEVAPSDLHEAYGRQARALADGGAHAILCRSFTEIEALCAAIRAAAEATTLPVLAGMTFNSGPEQMETTLGVTIPQACAAAGEAGAFMIGADGAENPDGLPAIVTLLAESGDLPVWVEVNAGPPVLVEGGVRYDEEPAAYGARLPLLREAGARMIMAGRGATLDHIAALASARKRPGKPRRK